MPAVIGPDVQRLVAAARREAARVGHAQTDSGHILLAMLADLASSAGQVLARSGITEQIVRSELERRVVQDSSASPVDSPDLQQALRRAARRAGNLGRRVAGWEDLLLSITDDGAVAAQIITATGLGTADVRDRALFTLNIPIPEPPHPPVTATEESPPETATADPDQPRRVFVINGRDTAALRAVREFVRSLGLLTVEFRQVEELSDSAAPLVPDTVSQIFPYAQAVVALLTPDEMVSLHPDLRRSTDGPYDRQSTYQSRPNVLYELGMALGVKPKQTIIVQIGDVRPFSNIIGRSVLRLDDGEPSVLTDFKDRLRRAGCPVNDQGTDWLRADRFTLLAARDRRPADPDS